METRWAKTRTTLGSAAGCNKPAGQTEDRAAEVVRNGESGVRRGVALPCTRRSELGNRRWQQRFTAGPERAHQPEGWPAVGQTSGCPCR